MNALTGLHLGHIHHKRSIFSTTYLSKSSPILQVIEYTSKYRLRSGYETSKGIARQTCDIAWIGGCTGSTACTELATPALVSGSTASPELVTPGSFRLGGPFSADVIRSYSDPRRVFSSGSSNAMALRRSYPFLWRAIHEIII